LQTTTIYVTHDQEEAMTLGERLVVMADGLIQQVGAPLAIYRRPVNRFVAGFLGSPSMNFIDGRLERIDGRLRFTDGRDVSVALDEQTAKRVGHAVGREVVLGVRPEQLRTEPIGDGEPSTIAIDVTVTEPLGDRMDVYGTTRGGSPMIARVDAAARCEPGSRAVYHVDPAALHLFEPGEKGRLL
jgi:multiple sugar transport system ATP-binding protein